MGIFDIFTGAPAKEAAASTRGFLDATKGTGLADITAGYNTATDAVKAGTAAGRTALGTGYDTSKGAVGAGATAALGNLDQGTLAALSSLGGAKDAFSPLSALGTKYGAGTDLYLDSLGVRGAEGNQRAMGSFEAGPGYQFQLDQGLDAINRRRNAGGMLASGNADRDATDYATGLAKTSYGDWQNRLAGLVNPELTATSGAATGVAGVGTSEANLLYGAGKERASVETGRAAMLSDLARTYGTSVAGLETGQGNTLANLATGAAGQKVGLATGLAAPYASTYKQEADASLAGNANMWKLGMEGAKLAMGMPF